MNKRVLLSIIIFIVGIILVGCNNDNKSLDGWEIDIVNKQAIIPKDAMDVYNSVNSSYKAVALLGKQVVAGTNYMFLCIDDNSYKVVVIYKNLENISTITSVSDFDVTKYVNENITNNNRILSGGWYNEIPSKTIMLDEKVQIIFDEAANKITDMEYMPIGVLAHQNSSGTNYAVLCYGNKNNDDFSSIYLLTLYEDLHGTREIVSSAYIDLATFNK